jgi:WD40 repeat protein
MMACDLDAHNQPATFVWKAGSKAAARQIASERLDRMVLSENGKWLAGGSGNTIQVFRLDQVNSAPIILRGHTQEPAGLAFSSDDSLLASGSFDGSIRVWSIADSTRQPWVIHVGETAFGIKFIEPKKLFYSGGD